MSRTCLVASLLLACVPPAFAGPRQQPVPTALKASLRPLERVERRLMPPVDVAKAMREDEQEAEPNAPRFAVAIPVALTPWNSGIWESVGDGTAVWRLRIASAGALSLNLGFTRYVMPAGGRLLVYSPDYRRRLRAFTAEDNEAHGQLWTPPLENDELVIEVTLPEAEQSSLELKLGAVNHDFKGFGTRSFLKSGSCNVDVACAQADPWQPQVRSVVMLIRNGTRWCSGALLNNTAVDGRPYILTAHHCRFTAAFAPTTVAVWNFENSGCRAVGGAASGGAGDGVVDDAQSGAILRASWETSDFTLLELDDPLAQESNVYFAGWDRSDGGFAAPFGVHHPNTDEKRISFTGQASVVTGHDAQIINPVPGDTHHQVFWSLGVTEPGSSGSPLFNRDGRVIGQLTGGPSFCGGTQLWDFYGRFFRSWDGGGTDDTRLSTWLDPFGFGSMTLDGVEQFFPALLVVGNRNAPSRVDLEIRQAMMNLGWGVALRAGTEMRGGLAAGNAVVAVAPSSSSSLGSRLRNVGVPVVMLKHSLFDDMRMTGTTSGTHFGTTGSQTRVVIRNAGHPLAAGLAGTPTVVTSASTFGWGVPSSSAFRAASINGSTTRFAVFGYEAGSSMVGLRAPARRVGLFLQDSSAPLTGPGTALLDASLAWAGGFTLQ